MNQTEELPIILKTRSNVQTGHNNKGNNTGQLDWDINTTTQFYSKLDSTTSGWIGASTRLQT
jgi:hypothetical protein